MNFKLGLRAFCWVKVTLTKSCELGASVTMSSMTPFDISAIDIVRLPSYSIVCYWLSLCDTHDILAMV